MNIKDIPPSYADYEQFNIDYERENFRYSDANYRVGEATIKVFLNWYPAPLRPLVRQVTYALLDEPLREAFGFPKASGMMTFTAEGALKLYGKIIRWLPARKSPRLYTQFKHRSYPSGYEIEQLGPPDEQ